MNHKFVNRENGKVAYYSAEGMKIFQKTTEYPKFKYVGPISRADQEAEEIAASQNTTNVRDLDEVESKKFDADLKKTVTAKSKQLSKKELDEITKGKKSVVGEVSDLEEEEEIEEEEAEAETEEEVSAEEKKLQEDIANLKSEKADGKAKGKAGK